MCKREREKWEEEEPTYIYYRDFIHSKFCECGHTLSVRKRRGRKRESDGKGKSGVEEN